MFEVINQAAQGLK